MLAVTSPLVWYLTRSTGIVALVLLTATVTLGMLTSVRTGGEYWPRFAISDLHRRISLLTMVFVVIHVVTAVMDTFVPIGWLSMLVPFTSKYKTLGVTLGTVSFDLLLAVAISSMLRGHISARLWRAVHWATYLSWPVAVIHTIQMGTDMSFGWVEALVAACCITVMMTFGWRVVARPVRAGAGTAASTEQAVQMVRDRRVEATSQVPDTHRPTAAGRW